MRFAFGVSAMGAAINASRHKQARNILFMTDLQ
jgi:hypothetical protein